MERDEATRIMVEEFGDRLQGEPAERNGWVTWSTRTSAQTNAKFVSRARARGVRTAFARDNRVGFMA